MGEEIEETGDFIVNEKDKIVNLTEQGVKQGGEILSISRTWLIRRIWRSSTISFWPCAHNYLMFRDQDYVVKDDEVLIVDEFTGRIMPGRRYSDGLHQAIEAKEHVKVKRESKTLATITFQNFFNKYDKKAGMTGTALTEEKSSAISTAWTLSRSRPTVRLSRKDLDDAVYKTKKEKFHAVVEEIEQAHAQGTAGSGWYHYHRDFRATQAGC
ncbi:MAG: hypothetical protein ACLUD2_00210 [Clostridium sp.]